MAKRRARLPRRSRIVVYAALAAFASLAVGATTGGCGSREPDNSPPAPAGRSATGGLATSGMTSGAYARIERGAHPLAKAEADVGALDPARRLENLAIVFKPSPAQTAERDALLEAVSDPASPSYHKWLTTAEYAARFGAKPDDVARTAAWLTEQGLHVDATSPLGVRLTFSGTVERIQAAFHVAMRRYLVGGEEHYAMASAPSIPAELADVVLALHNTHDFYKRPASTRMNVVGPASLCPAGNYCSSGHEEIAPPDWAFIYDVNPLYAANTGDRRDDHDRRHGRPSCRPTSTPSD